jgi:hypothetical protein
MTKLSMVVIFIALVLLMLVACKENIIESNKQSLTVMELNIEQIKTDFLEINERLDKLEIIQPIIESTTDKNLIRLANIQREYSLGTVKLNQGIMTLAEFDVLITSLVRGDPVLETSWTNVANGHTPSKEFEILMWARFMDAIIANVNIPEEEVVVGNG